MNEDNLIPAAHKLTVEEQSRGGKASGKSRRKKKNMKQLAEMLLQLPSNDSNDYQLLLDMGFDEEEVSHQLVINAALIQQAKSGDVKAVRVLMDITGADYYKNESLKLRKQELQLSGNVGAGSWGHTDQKFSA